MFNEAAALLVFFVLTHAAYRDLETHHVTDLHWIIIVTTGVIYVGVNDAWIPGLAATGLLAGVGVFLYKVKNWGVGDGLMLAPLGLITYNDISLFMYIFLIFGLGWMVTWKKVTGRTACPFVPGILASYTVFQLAVILGF